MAEQPKKCAHPACNCPAQEGSNYCGEYCSGTGDTADVVCHCGHSGCDTDSAV